jgi:sigma-B regulation protein RsbU (phosphoserine phosphatase)
LQTIIQEIINITDFKVNGGRIWQLDEESNSYILRYQFGNTKKIPEGFAQSIHNEVANVQLNRLITERTIHDEETNPFLRDRGIKYFYLTGVGEIIKLRNGKYFEYAIGFNSDSLSEDFNEALAVIGSFSTNALRSHNDRVEFQKFKEDVQKASEMQRNILPQHYLEYHDYKIFGLSIPDRGVSGDYFDYIKNTFDDEEHLSIVISDAASKGIPAAIEALFVSGAVRMGMAFASRIPHMLSILNNLINKTFKAERFVSLFHCELTTSSNRLVLYSNAGHPSPIHYRPSQNKFQLLEPTGGLLGLVENQKFGMENVRMFHGDILVLYTDGIDEAQDENGNLFGLDRIKDIIREYSHENSKIIGYKIIEEVQKFSARAIYTDDKTLVVIKRD